MAQSTHDFTHDSRTDALLINVNGVLVPRAEATVSVFDSGFMLGDSVWKLTGLLQGNCRSLMTTLPEPLEHAAEAMNFCWSAH